MNREDLRRAAEAEGIDAGSFRLDGGTPSEKYVLSLEPGGWAVYYSSRGRRLDELQFETEDEACSELLLRLVRDASTRIGEPLRGPLPRPG